MGTPLADRGSFAGVFFFLTEYELKTSFHNETLEFITEHPPETRLYKKAPREIPVSGFLCGSDAVLARDLLLRVTSSSTPKSLFLPSLGFVSAICLSFSLSEREQEIGSWALQFVFKEVPEKSLLPGSKFLADTEKLNALTDDYALEVIGTLQVLAVTAHGLRRITDAACKMAALLHSVNGLGLVPAVLDTLQESFSRIGALSKSPKMLLDALRRAFVGLTPTQASRTLLGVKKIEIRELRLFVQMHLLEKVPVSDREDLFFQLADELPTNESIRLLSAKNSIFSENQNNEPAKKWKPSNNSLSLLCAFESGSLKNEAEIIERNQSVFFCESTL